MSERIAVKTAQDLLNQAGTPVVVDGIWGRKSELAYIKSPDAVQNAVDKAVSKLGYNLDEIREKVAIDSFVSPQQMAEIINRVSSDTGVSPDTLQRFVDLEAARVSRDGVRYYVANAVNKGGYRGLFQFDAKGNAWADASKIGPLPEFNANWKDPYYNTLAAARYVMFNHSILQRKGYRGEMTGAIAYLMHNQGASGAYSIMTGKKRLAGKQSAAAVLVAAEAVQDFKSFA